MKKILDMLEEVIDTTEVDATIIVDGFGEDYDQYFVKIMEDTVAAHSRLSGKIFNDKKKRFNDGDYIITSVIMSYESTILNNAFIINTRNSKYLFIFVE